MHLAEALLPREDAIDLARTRLVEALSRNATYYDRVPGLRPDPERPLIERIYADDTWYFIPFPRTNPGAKPLMVRVNGVTKTVIIDVMF